VTGFPFNFIRHPQYIGAMTSLWYHHHTPYHNIPYMYVHEWYNRGMYILLHSDAHVAAGGFWLCLSWNIFYLITSLIEDNWKTS
jgi:hypothetical protein